MNTLKRRPFSYWIFLFFFKNGFFKIEFVQNRIKAMSLVFVWDEAVNTRILCSTDVPCCFHFLLTGMAFFVVHQKRVCDHIQTFYVNIYKIDIVYAHFASRYMKLHNCVCDHIFCQH